MLWKGLQIKKHDMEQRNGHQNNVKRLFHGTSHDTVATINQYGFNRSYAGKNGEFSVENMEQTLPQSLFSTEIEEVTVPV